MDGGRQGEKRRVGAARRRSRGHGPARLDGVRARATVANKVMESGKTAEQATASLCADRTASEARRPEAASRAGGVSRAERGNDGSPTGAKPRRGFDAQHDSATGHVSWPGTHGPQCGTSNWISLNSCSMYGEAGSATTAATFTGGSATQEQSQKTRRCFAIQLRCINV